jgi:hypothetical protein
MRPLILFCCAILMCAASSRGQSDEHDSYSISIVEAAIKSASQGTSLSQPQKNLLRLGDATSIAIVKLLSEGDLSNPQIVESFLPVIRQSFSYPQLISVDVDKRPKVTLFLLKYLEQQNIPDAQTQRDIEETIKFVKDKTTVQATAGSPN